MPLGNVREFLKIRGQRRPGGDERNSATKKNRTKETSTRSTSPESRRLRKVLPPPKSQMDLPDLR